MDRNIKQLLDRYFSGEATDQDIEELDNLLAEDAQLREQFLFAVETDSALREIALEEVMDPKQERKSTTKQSLLLPVLISIGILMALAYTAFAFTQNRPIAELVSSESAAWESDLPTAPGSQLKPGYLKLRSGLATVRFRSGVEVQLEAPAHLVLETPMRGKMLAGSAIIDVPEPAIGFIMEAPGSYAVDHGTRFSVSVDTTAKTSEYEVLTGEISVHHEHSGEVLRLTEKEAARVHSEGMDSRDNLSGEQGELPVRTLSKRLGTEGREKSVIRGSDLEDRLHPDFLMAKYGTVKPEYDRKSLFGFDLSEVTIDNISDAQIRLNLVPCGLGFAARLPENSTFSIYGISAPWDDSYRNWNSTPTTQQATLLESFNIPRSQQTGSFVIAGTALREFVRSNAGKEVTFLLVRDTDELLGNGLVHSFASSRHPKASGPTLTIW